MRKSIFSFVIPILTAALLLSVCGCAKTGTATPTPQVTAAPSPTPTPTPTPTAAPTPSPTPLIENTVAFVRNDDDTFSLTGSGTDTTYREIMAAYWPGYEYDGESLPADDIALPQSGEIYAGMSAAELYRIIYGEEMPEDYVLGTASTGLKNFGARVLTDDEVIETGANMAGGVFMGRPFVLHVQTSDGVVQYINLDFAIYDSSREDMVQFWFDLKNAMIAQFGDYDEANSAVDKYQSASEVDADNDELRMGISWTKDYDYFAVDLNMMNVDVFYGPVSIKIVKALLSPEDAN